LWAAASFGSRLACAVGWVAPGLRGGMVWLGDGRPNVGRSWPDQLAQTGTGLRPILNGLSENERAVYLAEYASRLRAAYRVANLATHHVLGFTIKLVMLVYFALAILFLVLRYAILPNIDYYKADIERAASRALGSQVSIARIYASWRGLRPNFFLGDVSLRDAKGRQVLALPSVSATLSWWSVAAGDVRFPAPRILPPQPPSPPGPCASARS